jgi:hypothetical protein
VGNIFPPPASFLHPAKRQMSPQHGCMCCIALTRNSSNYNCVVYAAEFYVWVCQGKETQEVWGIQL